MSTTSGSCTRPECDRPLKALGLCNAHYLRFKAGKPLDEPLRPYAPGRTCSVKGCDKPALAKRLCTGHYQRQAKSQPIDGLLLEVDPQAVCSVEACGKPHEAHGLCAGHRRRQILGKETGTPLRPAPAGAKRAKHGEGSTDKRTGYRVIRVDGKNKLEHRYVMEQTLGRPLLHTEEVHHKNGQRADNRPDNLELWSTSQPAGQRVEDKTAWAIEWLRLYAPEVLSDDD